MNVDKETEGPPFRGFRRPSSSILLVNIFMYFSTLCLTKQPIKFIILMFLCKYYLDQTVPEGPHNESGLLTCYHYLFIKFIISQKIQFDCE